MGLAEVAAALRKDVAHLLSHVANAHARDEMDQRKHGAKGIRTLHGEFESPDLYLWHYVLTISSRKTTIYPMGWYFNSQGVHMMQLDAEGPATYIGPHVLERYRQRYFKDADVLEAIQRFHQRNYDKASEPRPYQHYSNGIAAAIDDGYLLGELLERENLVHYHTFYDVPMGAKNPTLKGMRQLLEWRRYFTAMTPNGTGGGSDRYVNWGRGFEVRLERLRNAA